MLGRVADDVARRLGRLRPGRRLDPGDPPVKVNLGSGLEVAPGWIHVDGSLHALFAGAPAPVLRLLHRSSSTLRRLPSDAYVARLKGHRFIHHELEVGLPFPDRSVDFLFASHVLEHFFRSDAERLLRESLRVLRPGGVLRLGVPDLEHVVALYRAGQKKQALDFFFEGEEAGYYRRHRYMWDFELLAEALREAGFGEIERRSFREGRVPDLEQLDNRPEETLFVEAVRPT